MWRKIGLIAISAALICSSSAARADKQKTGTEDGNLYTDALYGFTFEKNDNWKFNIKDEKPEKPEKFRFRIQEANYQLPPERRFSRETWNVAYGGFFVDTTSLDLDQFKELLVTENRKNKQKNAFTKFAEIVRNGMFVAERRFKFGNLGLGYQLTFKQEYDAQIKDVRGNYDIITDHLMGDVYFTIDAGHVYIFFFTAERAEYRLCKDEIEKMLDTLHFPGRDEETKTTPADTADTTQAEQKTDTGK
jgi:hypothetical protein